MSENMSSISKLVFMILMLFYISGNETFHKFYQIRLANFCLCFTTVEFVGNRFSKGIGISSIKNLFPNYNLLFVANWDIFVFVNI